MKTAALLSVLAFAAAGLPAQAASPQIDVAIGPALAKKAHELGARDLDDLRGDLRRAIERELDSDKAVTTAGGKLDLTIVDAKPNRPTVEQMMRTPGLSYQSFGVGGAEISGTYTAPSAAPQALTYKWYETDIREAWWRGTWGDAQRAFDTFARRFARGEPLAK